MKKDNKYINDKLDRYIYYIPHDKYDFEILPTASTVMFNWIRPRDVLHKKVNNEYICQEFNIVTIELNSKILRKLNPVNNDDLNNAFYYFENYKMIQHPGVLINLRTNLALLLKIKKERNDLNLQFMIVAKHYNILKKYERYDNMIEYIRLNK